MLKETEQVNPKVLHTVTKLSTFLITYIASCLYINTASNMTHLPAYKQTAVDGTCSYVGSVGSPGVGTCMFDAFIAN